MAKHRFINVDFWQDTFVLDLTPEEKYFYLYIMTNSKTSQCGIYELPYRVIELETGYNRETVEKLLNRFVEYGKIKYSKETKELFILNWAKFNWNNSQKVIDRVKQELSAVKEQSFVKEYVEYVNSLEKNTVCIPYPYSIDSLWNKEKEKEKEKEKKEDQSSSSKNIFKLINDKLPNVFNGKVSTYVLQEIEHATNELGKEAYEIIEVAIDITLENAIKGRELNYLKSILNNWSKENVNTKEKALAKATPRKSKAQKSDDLFSKYEEKIVGGD